MTANRRDLLDRIVRVGFVLILLLLLILLIRYRGCGIYERSERIEWIE